MYLWVATGSWDEMRAKIMGWFGSGGVRIGGERETGLNEAVAPVTQEEAEPLDPSRQRSRLVSLVGVLARVAMLRSDYRQYPSYPHGYATHLFMGISRR